MATFRIALTPDETRALGPIPTAAPVSKPSETTLHLLDDFNYQRGFNEIQIGRVLKGDEQPSGLAVLCKVELPDTPITLDHNGKPGRRTVDVHSWGDHIFIGHNGWTGFEGDRCYAKEVDAFVTVERISDAYEQQITRTEWEHGNGHNHYRTTKQVVKDSTYNHPNGKKVGAAPLLGNRNIGVYTDRDRRPQVKLTHQWLRFRFTLEDGTTFEAQYAFEIPVSGKATVADDGTVTTVSNFYGAVQTYTHETLKQSIKQVDHYGNGSYITQEKNNPLSVLLDHMRNSEVTDGIERWWTLFFGFQPNAGTPDTKGLSAVLKKKANKACFETLAADYKLQWAFYCWLMSGKTSDKQQNNKFLRAVFEECGFDAAKIAAEADRVMGDPGNVKGDHGYGDKGIYFGSRRKLCQQFGTSKEVIRVIEAKTDFRKRKTAAGKADGLGIDADIYPLLRAAVEAQDIPASVFANPNGNPLNREYALWERALKQKGWAESIYKIAQDAARRSTYEKDVTPYLAFLFKLGPYLDRHTPGRKKWSCFPSYVESEWQLEMGDDGEGFANGTVKRRSAFTPVADNETRVVTVPYVAVCVTGRVSQWCYSKEYYVFEEMMIDPISKGVVINEVETKLNGRDDYGLMFYTLNGSATAQGYPTFLIIFERRTGTPVVANKGDLSNPPRTIPGKANTFVHFHRVHPKRKQNGLWTPACDLIAKTYQYMAGNVPAADVAAQQGDMIYILHGSDPLVAGAKVEEVVQASRQLNFESHNHCALGDGEIKLHVSTAKTPKNRLGFMQVPVGGMAVRHPEHDDIEYLQAGWYEVRRCRSWEANPVAIWSLTID